MADTLSPVTHMRCLKTPNVPKRVCLHYVSVSRQVWKMYT